MYSLHYSASGSTPSALEQPIAKPALRQAALWLGLGGALLVLTYALELVFGLRYGREHSSADVATLRLAWAILFAFTLGLLVIAIGLFRLASALRPHIPRVALGGMALAGVAFVLMPLNMAFMLGVFGPPQHRQDLMHPVLTNLAATALLSAVVLRRRLLPRAVGLMLLVAGVITFPFIMLTIPLELIMPPFLIADLPFAAWGAALIATGWILRRYAGR